MSTVIKSLAIAILLLTSLSAATGADEHPLMEAVAELRQNGRVQEAEKLEAAVMAKIAARKAQSAEADAHARVAQKLNERLLDLLTAEREFSKEPGADAKRTEIREQVEKIRRELEEMSRPHARNLPPEVIEQTEKLERAGRRLHHLRVAAENLKAAEMHDMAHAVMEKAGHLEKEVHAQKEELAHAIRNHHRGESGHPPEHVAHEEMNHLRQEVEALRRELKEAHQSLDKLRERAKTEESALKD
jgi:hypothetical protein